MAVWVWVEQFDQTRSNQKSQKAIYPFSQNTQTNRYVPLCRAASITFSIGSLEARPGLVSNQIVIIQVIKIFQSTGNYTPLIKLK